MFLLLGLSFCKEKKIFSGKILSNSNMSLAYLSKMFDGMSQNIDKNGYTFLFLVLLWNLLLAVTEEILFVSFVLWPQSLSSQFDLKLNIKRTLKSLSRIYDATFWGNGLKPLPVLSRKIFHRHLREF